MSTLFVPTSGPSAGGHHPPPRELHTTEATDLSRRFQSLITNSAVLCSKETLRLKKAIDAVLPGFRDARNKWAESPRKSADDFNLFEVMEVGRDEGCHSKILAWLLDHRIEYGTHAQGNLGFRLFLQQWTDARLLEVAMTAVRQKYEVIFDEVIKQFQKNHGELNCSKKNLLRVGEVGIGKDSWPVQPNGWPSGFYVSALKLEELTSSDRSRPYKAIWLYRIGYFDIRHFPKLRTRRAKLTTKDSSEALSQNKCFTDRGQVFKFHFWRSESQRIGTGSQCQNLHR